MIIAALYSIAATLIFFLLRFIIEVDFYYLPEIIVIFLMLHLYSLLKVHKKIMRGLIIKHTQIFSDEEINKLMIECASYFVPRLGGTKNSVANLNSLVMLSNFICAIFFLISGQYILGTLNICMFLIQIRFFAFSGPNENTNETVVANLMLKKDGQFIFMDLETQLDHYKNQYSIALDKLDLLREKTK